jgi:hypothetical protein
MLSKFLDPLARPLLIVAMGALFGLLIAASHAFSPLPFDVGQPPLLSGLIAGTGAVLFLGLAALVFDTLAWLGVQDDEEPPQPE